jgi:gliding motility-associated-like protein
MQTGAAQTVYTPATVTGLNQDIVANAAGTVASSTTSSMDQETVFGSNWCFAAPSFVNPAGLQPSTSLPATGLIASAVAATPGLSYQLASYSAPNSLRIPGVGSGTLTLTTPRPASTVYVLAASGSGDSPSIIVNVTFTDQTLQAFVVTVPDWFGGSNAAITGVSRVNYDNNTIENNTTDPRLYQIPLQLLPANATKLVQSVTFTKTLPTAVLNVMALTLARPCTLPTGSAQASPTSVCAGQPVQLSLTTAGTATGYTGQWQASTNNGTTWTSIAGATAATLTVNPVVSTLYRFQAACGVQLALLGPVAVVVNAATPATLAYSPTTICRSAGSLPAPTVTPAGGTFSAPAGLALNPTTGVVTPGSSTPGTYTVTYSPAGPCTVPATTSLTILPTPVVSLAFNGQAFCKAGAAPVASASPAGGTFRGPAGLLINAASGAVDLNGSTPGTYTVTYTSPGPCVGQAAATLTILPAPVVSLAFNGQAFCKTGAAPVVSASPAGGTFSGPVGLLINATSGAVDLNGSTPGTYTVTYSSAGPCNVPATASLTILPAPVVSLAFNGQAFCKAGAAPVASASPAGGTFSGPAGLLINAASGAVDLDGSANGTYTVTYTSPGTCAGQAAATLTIQGNKAPTYPTVLTPNGDDLNDKLLLKISDVQNYYLQVFNRWGTRVYESRNAAEGWAPTSNSGGIYYYLVEYTDCAGRPQRERSWIDVLK